MTKRIVVIVSLIFIIVEFAAFWKVEDFHNNEIEQYLEKQTDLLAVKLNTAQQAYILVSKNIFEQNIINISHLPMQKQNDILETELKN